MGAEALASHQGIIQSVVRSGTKVSLLLHCHQPSPSDYLIERTVPNPPSVKRAKTGEVLDVTPSQLVPQIQVFGQHEISEVARSPEKRTRLLERFVAADQRRGGRGAALRRDLAQSRSQLLATRVEAQSAQERLAALPSLEETERRFREAGGEERLQERSLLVRKERVIATASARVTELESLQHELPVDRAFVSSKALADLPGHEALAGLNLVLERLNDDLGEVTSSFESALTRAREGIGGVREQWEERRQTVEAQYAKILRELQKSQVDGSEFIELRHQIEELRPLREQVAALGERETSLVARRDYSFAPLALRCVEAPAGGVTVELRTVEQVDGLHLDQQSPVPLGGDGRIHPRPLSFRREAGWIHLSEDGDPEQAAWLGGK